uniref:Putative secreted protein n=1 Tax=Anopheles darlingi TaxID=43151 RepID=A0A2M4DRN8_ANODA
MSPMFCTLISVCGVECVFHSSHCRCRRRNKIQVSRPQRTPWIPSPHRPSRGRGNACATTWMLYSRKGMYSLRFINC